MEGRQHKFRLAREPTQNPYPTVTAQQSHPIASSSHSPSSTSTPAALVDNPSPSSMSLHPELTQTSLSGYSTQSPSYPTYHDFEDTFDAAGGGLPVSASHESDFASSSALRSDFSLPPEHGFMSPDPSYAFYPCVTQTNLATSSMAPGADFQQQGLEYLYNAMPMASVTDFHRCGGPTSSSYTHSYIPDLVPASHLQESPAPNFFSTSTHNTSHPVPLPNFGYETQPSFQDSNTIITQGRSPALANTRISGKQRAIPSKVCSNCGTSSTPVWRKAPRTSEVLCNACGLYLQNRHVPRPHSAMGRRCSSSRDSHSSRDASGLGLERSRSAAAGTLSMLMCGRCGVNTSPEWRGSRDGEILCIACSSVYR